VSSKIGRLGAGRAGGRTSLSALLCAAAVALAWGACGPALASTAPEQRGFLSDGVAGVMLFQRCEAGGRLGAPRVLQDRTPGLVLSAGIAAVQQVRLDADRPLYVEFAGEVAGRAVNARLFRRAVGHLDDCNAVPARAAPRVLLSAYGNTPPWRVLAAPGGTQLDVPGAKPLRFLAPQPAAGGADPTVRMLKARPMRGADELRIEVTDQLCEDAASESAYGARVRITLGQRTLEGCAERF